MPKLKVKTICDDIENGDFKKGEEGLVVGFIRGWDNRPRVVMQTGNSLIMVPFNLIEVIEVS